VARFAVFRCSWLLLISIEIDQNFTVFRTVAGYGRASTPVLAEDLQALTIRCDHRAHSQYYRYSSFARNARIRPPPRHANANYYKDTQLSI